MARPFARQAQRIGLTSRAMQLASQITEPDHAPLMDDTTPAVAGDNIHADYGPLGTVSFRFK